MSAPGADPAPDAAVALAIVGAGPCGLAVAVAAQAAGVSAITFDRGCLVSGIAQYPAYMQFFSTALSALVDTSLTHRLKHSGIVSNSRDALSAALPWLMNFWLNYTMN